MTVVPIWETEGPQAAWVSEVGSQLSRAHAGNSSCRRPHREPSARVSYYDAREQ